MNTSRVLLTMIAAIGLAVGTSAANSSVEPTSSLYTQEKKDQEDSADDDDEDTNGGATCCFG